MPIEGLQQYLHLVINTGNVLNVNKKAGQKPSEEVRLFGLFFQLGEIFIFFSVQKKISSR